MSGSTSSLQQLHDLRRELVTLFPEREGVIDGALAALLAGEHVLLLGPPGTGKSALVRALAGAFDARYFEVLLTKFSTPEELFGPISLKALEQDQFSRVVAGKLPEAELAFVDETFKANSAILNALLTVVNERLFHNGGQPMKVPLLSLFGASNELPEGRELEALFDRFALRFEVPYLSRAANFRAVVTRPLGTPATHIPLPALRQWQDTVAQVALPDATVEAVLGIRETCKADGIVASDRRWKKSLGIARAFAFLGGNPEVTIEDLAFLPDALWREPKDRAVLARVVGPIVDPIGHQAREILDAALEEAARVGQPALREDRKAYLAEAAKALDAFRGQQKRLEELDKTAGRRARGVVADARQQIQQLHQELARTISAGLGLRTVTQ